VTLGVKVPDSRIEGPLRDMREVTDTDGRRAQAPPPANQIINVSFDTASHFLEERLESAPVEFLAVTVMP
jgi:hypothetical protein